MQDSTCYHRDSSGTKSIALATAIEYYNREWVDLPGTNGVWEYQFKMSTVYSTSYTYKPYCGLKEIKFYTNDQNNINDIGYLKIGGWNVDEAGAGGYDEIAAKTCAQAVSAINPILSFTLTGLELAEALQDAPDLTWESPNYADYASSFAYFELWVDPDTTWYINFNADAYEAFQLFLIALDDPNSHGEGKISYGETSPSEPQPPEPELTISPTNYDFGDVKIGSSKTKTFTLKNTGDATAEIYTIDMNNDPSMAPNFIFNSEDPYTFANDILLEPGETIDIPVGYIPTIERHDEGQIRVLATNCDNVYADLKGTGFKPCCFPAGTKITMAHGSCKNIEHIRVGDRVLSYDIKNRRFTSWTVKMLGKPVHPLITINNCLIQATVDHPFYVKKTDGREGWAAYDLERAKNAITFKGDLLTMEVGDQLYTSNGEWIEITEIEYNQEPVQTYNILSFSGTKTYFANDVLVYEEHPPHFYTDWFMGLLGEKFPRLEQLLLSNPFFNKLLRYLQ